jgi:hypothetical protein
MKQLSRQISPPLALAILVTALLCTACPSSNDLDRAAKASSELAHDTLIANQVVLEFFKAGKVPLAEKDKIADKLGVIGDKGQKLNALLIDLDKKYPQGTAPPQDVEFVKQNLSELRQLYSDVLASLLPFKAQKAVGKLDQHLTTIEKAVSK